MRIVPPKVLIELRPSPLDGVGVFAASAIKIDQRVAAGVAASDYHRLISWANFDEYESGVREKIAAFCVGTPDGFIPPDKLDFNRISIEWYLNHSCHGNVGFNEDGDFVARRLVRKGDELTYDYALAESNPHFRMECRCGAAQCRSVITGNDWKDPEFREKNLGYMLPRLRRASEGRRLETAKAVRAVARRR
jgi:hypothetical protein